MSKFLNNNDIKLQWLELCYQFKINAIYGCKLYLLAIYNAFVIVYNCIVPIVLLLKNYEVALFRFLVATAPTL